MKATAILSLLILTVGCGDDEQKGADTATAGTDTAVDSGALDTSPAPDTEEVVPMDTSVQDGEVGEPACDYVFTSQVSYLTKLAIASVADSAATPADHCCFDFNSDADLDNRIGEIARLVQGLPQIKSKINDVLATNIANGTVTVLVELVGASDISVASNATLNVFYGKDMDSDAANNMAGEGDFTANISSFMPGTDEPATSFEGVTIANKNLFAGPSVFRLTVPIAPGLVIDADIERAKIEGVVGAAAAGGFTLDGATPDGAGGTYGAKLGGVIPEADLFGAFNTFVASRCGCLDLGAETQLLSQRDGKWQCAGATSTGCDGEDAVEKQCVTLAQICDAALLFITPDIDTDGAGGPDAYSVGLWLKGAGAEIKGVDPASCP